MKRGDLLVPVAIAGRDGQPDGVTRKTRTLMSSFGRPAVRRRIWRASLRLHGPVRD